MTVMAILYAFILGYVIGSPPFGLIITRIAGAGDIRSMGSGNIGATNVLRTGKKSLAALTLLLDFLKGFAAVQIARAIFVSETGGDYWTIGMAAAAGAVLGHCFSLFLRFKGGKGVATYLGVLLALAWPVVAAFALVWLAIAFLTRYSSLAGLTACLMTPIVLFLFGENIVAALFLAMTGLVFWRHKANIERLLAGTEGKIGAK